MRGRLRIGTSGWSYPSGRGTWDGIFYPARGRAHRPRGFDELRYYAERFDTVEVNSTFYGPPSPERTRAWADRTPPGFEFTLKLYRKFTHPKMYREATGHDDASVTPADVDALHAGLAPLAETGKLGALLAQFPPSFKAGPDTRAYLDWLLDTLRETPAAVELRHRSWSDDLAGTLTLLNRHGAAWAQIDEPKFRFSIAQNQLPNVTSFYYMRLHGRNAKQWWRHDHVEDHYNYLYSADELAPIAETADAAGHLVKKLYLYLNNHHSAKAVVNAAVLKHRLGLPNPGVYPDAFVDRYPEVEGLVERASVGARRRARGRAPSLLTAADEPPAPAPVRQPGPRSD